MSGLFLFAGDNYYPRGGIADLVFCFEGATLSDVSDEAIAAALISWIRGRLPPRCPDWAHLAAITSGSLHVVRKWAVASDALRWSDGRRTADSAFVEYQPYPDDDEMYCLRLTPLPL